MKDLWKSIDLVLLVAEILTPLKRYFSVYSDNLLNDHFEHIRAQLSKASLYLTQLCLYSFC